MTDFGAGLGPRRAGRTVDCATHSTAGRQLLIGGINNGIDGQGGDIDLPFHHQRCMLKSTLDQIHDSHTVAERKKTGCRTMWLIGTEENSAEAVRFGSATGKTIQCPSNCRPPLAPFFANLNSAFTRRLNDPALMP
jgi:hypothetical protein